MFSLILEKGYFLNYFIVNSFHKIILINHLGFNVCLRKKREILSELFELRTGKIHKGFAKIPHHRKLHLFSIFFGYFFCYFEKYFLFFLTLLF